MLEFHAVSSISINYKGLQIVNKVYAMVSDKTVLLLTDLKLTKNISNLHVQLLNLFSS